MDRLRPVTKRVLHVILVSFWTVVILGAFIAQIIACFRRDKVHVPQNSYIYNMWLCICTSVDIIYHWHVLATCQGYLLQWQTLAGCSIYTCISHPWQCDLHVHVYVDFQSFLQNGMAQQSYYPLLLFREGNICHSQCIQCVYIHNHGKLWCVYVCTTITLEPHNAYHN